jgi:NTP pyrophosphatase (non-canonical NTP hydrolase)
VRDAQAQVAAFVARHELAVSVAARLLDLTAEVGELAKEVLQEVRRMK